MNTKELFYQRFVTKNDSVCNISEVNDEEISYYGEGIQLQAKSKLKESDLLALEIANDAVLNKASKKVKKIAHEINDPKAKGANPTAVKGTNPNINPNKPMVPKAADTNISIPTNFPPTVTNEVKPTTNSVLDQFKKPTKVVDTNNNNSKDSNKIVQDSKNSKTNTPIKENIAKEVSSRPSTATATVTATVTATATTDAGNKSEQKVDNNSASTTDKKSKKGTKKSSDDTSPTTNKISKDKKDIANGKKKDDNESMLPDFSGITSSLNALKEKAKNKLDSTTNALGLTSKPVVEVKKDNKAVIDVKSKTEETFESALRRNKDEQNTSNSVSNDNNNNNYDSVSEEVTFGGNAHNNDAADIDEEQEAVASLSLLTGAKNLFSKMVNRKENEKKTVAVTNNTIEKKTVEQVSSGISNPEGYLVPQLKRRPIVKEFHSYDMERYDPHAIPDIQQDNITDQNKCSPGSCVIS